jgi:excisionase family DNA binding protein
METTVDAGRGALTVEEAAHWLGISTSQAYKLIQAGRIPAKNLGASGKGRCLRVSRAWLERWMEQPDDLEEPQFC